MGQEPVHATPEFRALKAALEEEWPQRNAAIDASGVPLNKAEETETETEKETETETESETETETETADDGLDLESAKSALKRAREEAAKHRIAARDAAAKVKEYEDKDKTDTEKLQERAKTAEERAATAERNLLVAQVALDKGLTQTQAKRLVGTTKEELEADADELLASFKSEDDGGQEPPAGRPRERLRSGTVPGATPEETDPAKLAEQVPRSYGRR